MEYLLDDAMLDARRFEIVMKRLADDILYGVDASAFTGAGVEYAQSRPYVWGDSVRSIDWRVTARTGRFHVKEYEASRRTPCHLLVDGSASMTVGSQRLSKYGLAVQLAGGLALACLERSTPVGVVTVGGAPLVVRPSLARGRILQWMHHLRVARCDGRTEIAARTAELAAQQSCRALVVVLSDLHDPQGLQSLKPLGQRHDCIVLQLRDPAERGLAGAGFVRAREAETGREFVAYGKRSAVDPRPVKEELRRAGIDHLLLDLDRPVVAAVRNFLVGRTRLARGAR